MLQYKIFNLGCLHAVAHVISYDVGFNPSTQRHYRRLIGRTTETCSCVYISNILTYDSDVGSRIKTHIIQNYSSTSRFYMELGSCR
jgi:hypothetical protein